MTASTSRRDWSRLRSDPTASSPTSSRRRPTASSASRPPREMQSMMRDVVCHGTAEAAQVAGVVDRRQDRNRLQGAGRRYVLQRRRRHPQLLLQLRRLLPGRGPPGHGADLDRRADHRVQLGGQSAAPMFSMLVPTIINELRSFRRPVPPVAMETEAPMPCADARTGSSVPDDRRARAPCCPPSTTPSSTATRRSPCPRSRTTPARSAGERDVRLPARHPPRRPLLRRGGRRRRRGVAARRSPARPAPGARDVNQLVVDDTRLALGPSPPRSTATRRRRCASSASPAPTARRRRACSSPRSCAPPAIPTSVIGTLSGTYTTPEAPELQSRLAAIRDGATARW